MDGVTDLGTITVWGSNPRPHFNDCFNNYDNAHEDIDLTGRYEKLKSILHENLYDNIKLTDIHDDVNNHKIDAFHRWFGHCLHLNYIYPLSIIRVSCSKIIYINKKAL